jgi:hypothetical protein
MVRGIADRNSHRRARKLAISGRNIDLPGRNYMDWYGPGGEGDVNEQVRTELAALGWEPGGERR